jgi:hypothetical protein
VLQGVGHQKTVLGLAAGVTTSTLIRLRFGDTILKITTTIVSFHISDSRSRSTLHDGFDCCFDSCCKA